MVAVAGLMLGASPAYASPTVSGTISVGSGMRPVALAISPDGLTVYAVGSNTLWVINTATNSVTATIPVGSRPSGVAVSPDGHTVYVTNQNDNTMSVINTTTNPMTVTTHSVGNYPTGVAVLPAGADQGMVYVAGMNDHNVWAIDPTFSTAVAIPIGTSPFAVAAAPGGSTVYVTDSNANTVSVINTATNTVTATIPVGGEPEGVAVSPDGSAAYVADMNSNTVSVIDTATNTVTATIPVSGAPYWVAVSPDGSTVYVTDMNSNSVSTIDTATNTVTHTIAVGLNPFQVAVSAAGATQGTGYVTNFDGTLSVLTEPTPPTDPPTDLVTRPGSGQVGLSWTAPSSGSDPITDYLIEVSGDGGTTWTPCAHSPSSATTATVTGLTNGTAYTFRVSAINSGGTGPASAASSSVTPRAAQSITFTAPSTGTVGGTQTLSATASSGLAVAFIIDPTSTSGACTLAGTTVTFTGAGSCVLDADQYGSAAYFAAPQVQQSITVAAPTPTSSPTRSPTPAPSPSPTSTPNPSAGAGAGAKVALSNPTPNAQARETFSASGLRPGSTATFTLHSRPYLLGTATVDRTGTASLTVTLPAGFTGPHTIVVQAIAANGTALTLDRPITIKSIDIAASPGGTGLAATGVSDLPALLGTALGLLSAGFAVLLLAGRRRRATHVD